MDRIELAKMLGLELDSPCVFGADSMPDENTLKDVLSDIEKFNCWWEHSFCEGKIIIRFDRGDMRLLTHLNNNRGQQSERYEEIIWERAAHRYLEMVSKAAMRLGGD